MNYNICIIWWRVIASSCNKSLVFERLKLISLRDLCVCVCVCVCLWNRLFFFWHINLSQYRVTNLPSVDIEREYASKSGAGDAGVVFL